MLILVFLGLSVLDLDRMYATDTSLDAYICAAKATDRLSVRPVIGLFVNR